MKKTKNQKKNKKKTKTSNIGLKPKQRSGLAQKVLQFMKAHKDQSFSSKELATETNLWKKTSNSKLRSVMDDLTKEGKLAYLDKGRYQYVQHSEFMVGKIQINRNGSGYLLVEQGDDIFIPSEFTGKSMNGDMVKVKLLPGRRKSKKKEGMVKEVVARARTVFVGVVEEGLPDTYFLIPDDTRINTDFFIPRHALNGAKDGQKALVELVNWERKSPEVKVIEVFGEEGENQAEMHAILMQYGFNPNFPVEVEKEAKEIPEQIPQEEINKRLDIRGITTFTIDPVDAKDFDDALSYEPLENGNVNIGVHIADVSYYVKPDSFIDREAFKRATSVYLVDRTVPMLPEKLSNNLCSLRPREDRLAYSIIFEMDQEATILNQWIGRTVIYSDHRFTYEEAQEVIEGTIEGPYALELQQLNILAKKLKAKRLKKGSIEFDTNEVKFELDEHDKPIRVIKKIRKDANKLIEDFMLLANRRIAAHLYHFQSNPPLPSVYRVHDSPDPEKLMALGEFASHFGHMVTFHNTGEVSERLNELMNKVQGTPEQNVIESIAIRSMAKAIYTTKNIGHFGLGFQYYTHFTSPIRRYPDLLIHRLLTKYHHKQYNENPVVLEDQCKYCSDRERQAAEAERSSIKFKQVEFLEDKVGQEFNGIISGVIESGIFVELDENLCEGFVSNRNMESDYYVYEAENFRMVGRSTGESLQLGDPVLVEIADTNLRRKTVDMVLIKKLKEKASLSE